MSKFKTIIPTTINSVVSMLPKGAYVHSVALQPNHTIEIIWDSDTMKTPYTFPSDYSLERLQEPKQATSEEILGVRPKVVVDKRTKQYKESIKDAKS